MEDEPLLHSRQFDDLVLEYLFRDCHCSFPNRNPHMNRLTHMMIRVSRSTIAEPFQADYLGFKMVAFVLQVFKFVGSCTAHIPKIVVDVNFP